MRLRCAAAEVIGDYMYIRFSAIAGLVAVVATISASSAAASRSCGTTHLLQGDASVRVTIDHGSVSCAEARAVIRLYGSSREIPHGPTRHGYGTYPEYPGWRCYPLFHGDAKCQRGGSIHHPRDKISLQT